MNAEVMENWFFVNAIASSIVSNVGNIILVFLVIKYTNKELKPYKRILIIQIVFDLIYSVVGPLSKYSRQLHNGILYYIFSKTNFGFLLPLNFAAFFATSGFFFTNAIENILPLHFVYRYLLICHNKTMGYFSLFIAAFFCLLPASAVALAFALCFWPDENYEMYKELLKNSSIENGKNLPLFIATKFEVISRYSYFGIVLSAVDYAIIGFCSFCLVWHFKDNKSSMSPKTLQIQKQFNKALFIEAAMPFFFSFVPQILNYFGTWLKMSIFSFGSTYMLFLMPWTAALNPVVTIYVIIAYRKRFLQKILCRKDIVIFDSSIQKDTATRSVIIKPIKIN